MAASLPWSVKGVDPRTRDAAKAAARRAGMTLGEWLDHKIRVEAGEEVEGPSQPEQLDIAALSERLAKLSQGRTAASHQAATAGREPALSRRDIETVIDQAASAERLTRESSAKTAGALDSIARWIEKTENRMVSSERAAAERQERATSVIADAIKTMGERLVEIERKAVEAPHPAASPARPRLAFSREHLADAVSDIRTRQRDLDPEREPLAQSAIPESRIAALRQDLRDLSARIAPSAIPATPPRADRPAAPARPESRSSTTESMLADLAARLDRLDRRERLEPVLKPLARIESDLSRLSQDRAGESYQRVEMEIANLAAKVDALAARGADRAVTAPVLRDIAELREMLLASSGHEGRIDEISQQIASLSFEIGRMREAQTDNREIRGLSLAIEDVRDAILSDHRNRPAMDPAALASLSGQVEALARKLDALPTLNRDALSAHAEMLAQRLDDLDQSGSGASSALASRLDTLMARLEDMASRQPAQIESRIDRMQQRLEMLAEQGPVTVTRQIEALAGRIESMAAASNLTQMVHDGVAPAVQPVNLRPIEDMLRTLAAKIDEAGRPGAEADAFDSLEQQISGLASRLDAAVATRSAETGIERTLQDLVVHLKSLRQETSEAASRAAQEAVAAVGARPDGQAVELSALLSGLRETHLSSGRETQDAIGAVHQTLETIISRLGSIEAELAQERQTPSPPPLPPRARTMPAASGLAAAPPSLAAAAADRIAPERSEPRQPELPAATALDLPLEPGSGRPRPGTAPDLSAPGAGTDPQSIRQNLIAAARRSAKAASDAAAPIAAAPEAEGKGRSRIKDAIEKRRRPILLGLAAIVLAMGTAHVVKGVLTEEAPTTELAGEIAAPTAASKQAAAEPEAPPAVNDQTALAAPAAEPAPLPVPPPAAESAPAPATPPAFTLNGPSPASPADSIKPATNIGDLPANLGSEGLRKQAQAGDARAVYQLATLAADGPAASRDPKLALRLFERAAVAGLAPAQFRVGNMFEKGIGIARDPGLARVWYARAAERGNAKAMHNLAVLHAEGVSGKPDYAMATEWFRKAAEVGVRDSQYNLAILLGRGLGAPADLAQSYVWFAVAASQGDEDAGRKRDEVAQRLSAPDLAAAKAKVESWKPKLLDSEANEVAVPTVNSAETPAPGRKPAKPVRG